MLALRDRFESGLSCMGGTSAGAAVMSGGVMVEGGMSYEALKFGASDDAVLPDHLLYVADGGIGFAGDVIVDTHFSQRGREGRLIREGESILRTTVYIIHVDILPVQRGGMTI